VSALGDLAEALIEAPRCRTLHLRGTHRLDMDVLQRSWESSQGGGAVGRVVLRALESSGTPEPPEPPADSIETWIELGEPPRWRHRHGSSTTVVDRESSYTRFGDDLVVTPRGDDDELPHPIRPVLDGVVLLAHYRLEPPDEVVLFDRPAWRTTIHQRRRIRPHEAVLAGDRAVIDVDRVTGILLGYECFQGDDLLARLTLDLVEVDPELDEALFEPELPPGGRRKTIDEVMAERKVGRMREPTVEDLVAEHEAAGEVPDDADEARAEITAAVKSMFVPSDDGTHLPSVRASEGLGDSVAAAQRRFHPEAPATVDVLGVAFDDERQATVWFSVGVGANRLLPQAEGRVVRTSDGWKVARATVARLLRMAGVDVPPPK
jgi:hypothetical protein